MKSKMLLLVFLMSTRLFAQNNEAFSPFNGDYWGVVLEHPDMKNVVLKKDILYLKDDKSSLHIDVYLPPHLKKREKRPAIIFLNGIGDEAGLPPMKSSEIYKSWPKLIAAHGYIGISMETDGSRVHECFDALFNYLAAQGALYHVDADRLGVYAASANTRASASYLMGKNAYSGIKAAVFFYGSIHEGPYRKDLPVFFVVSEGDAGNNYADLWPEVLKNNSPWTIKMASGLPHAFDAFSDNNEARKVVKETISFWKNQLDPIPNPSWPTSKIREIIEMQYWGDHAKIVSLMKAWLKENPDSKDISAISLYANSLMRTNEFAEAEIFFKKSLELNPTENGTLLGLALLSYILDKPVDGEKYLAQYEKRVPPEQFTYFYLANYLYDIKKHRAAIPHYEKALTFEPRSAYLFYNLACCYALTGEKSKAFENLNQAIAQGFNSKPDYEKETNLEPLKTDSRWEELMKKLE